MTDSSFITMSTNKKAFQSNANCLLANSTGYKNETYVKDCVLDKTYDHHSSRPCTQNNQLRVVHSNAANLQTFIHIAALATYRLNTKLWTGCLEDSCTMLVIFNIKFDITHMSSKCWIKLIRRSLLRPHKGTAFH